MKTFIFCIISFLLSINSVGQVAVAEIDTVEGILINRYLKNKHGIYCEMETQLLYKLDTIVFFQKSILNSNILKRYPRLTQKIGEPSTYENDYLLEFSKGIFKYDLTISKYNYHTEEYGSKVVKSPFFYQKDSSDNLYSVYQFKGCAVFYKDIMPFESYVQHDCLCPELKYDMYRFAVLKEVINLKPLSDMQVNELELKKSGIRSVEVFFCE